MCAYRLSPRELARLRPRQLARALSQEMTRLKPQGSASRARRRARRERRCGRRRRIGARRLCHRRARHRRLRHRSSVVRKARFRSLEIDDRPCADCASSTEMRCNSLQRAVRPVDRRKPAAQRPKTARRQRPPPRRLHAAHVRGLLVASLEQIPFQWNWNSLELSFSGRIFCGEPVSTSPENTLYPTSRRIRDPPCQTARSVFYRTDDTARLSGHRFAAKPDRVGSGPVGRSSSRPTCERRWCCETMG